MEEEYDRCSDSLCDFMRMCGNVSPLFVVAFSLLQQEGADEAF